MRRVLHGEGFSTTHHDTVGDDQTDENRQLLADAVGVRLEHLINHDYQRRDDHHLHDHTDRAGDLVANDGNEEVGQRSYRRQRDTHDQSHVKAGGYRQRRTDTEDLQGNRVVAENRFEQNLFGSGFSHDYASPARRCSRNGPNPSSPSQKRTRFSTPRLVSVAPASASTWCSAFGLLGSTPPLMTLMAGLPDSS